MPKLSLSADEAKTLKRKRARDKAWNAPLQAAVTKVKRRLKGADAMEADTLNKALSDLPQDDALAGPRVGRKPPRGLAPHTSPTTGPGRERVSVARLRAVWGIAPPPVGDRR